MAFNEQDGKIRTLVQKDQISASEDGQLRSTSQKDSGAGVTVPVLDEGMLVGGMQPILGGLA